MLTAAVAVGVYAACGVLRRCLDRPDREDRTYCRGRIRLTALRNYGAAFDLPIEKTAILAGSATILITAVRNRRRHPLAAGLLLGGGCANLAERLSGKGVYDYLQFPPCKYVFNLADEAIVLGLVGGVQGVTFPQVGEARGQRPV